MSKIVKNPNKRFIEKFRIKLSFNFSIETASATFFNILIICSVAAPETNCSNGINFSCPIWGFFAIPGISTPVKLGLAGGPIVVGILIGCFGPRFHLITYTTRSANLMLRGIGLSLYLACLGLDAGAHFFETVMRPEGAIWIAVGFAITFIPVVIMALVALRISHLDFGSTCGMLCGSMANPMALNYANDTLPGDNPAVSYATVYPLSMFSRVIIAQLILMFFI